MCKVMKAKGVLDRFSDHEQAVILIEELKKEVIVKISELPANSKENMWFTIKLQGDDIVEITIDREKADKESQKSTDLMEKLQSKSRGSKFKRS